VTLTRAITVESITDAPASEPFHRRPGLLERAVATVMLFVFAFSLPTEWFVRVANSSAGTVEGGSPVTTLVFLSFLGVVWLGFNGNWHIAAAAAGREPLLVALVGLAGLSTIWSVSLGETLAASIVLIITFIVGLYFASRFRLEETLFLAGIALTIGLFANYMFIFVFQDFGLDTINVGTEGGSNWSGVFVTKNELGRIASLSFIVFGFLARIRRSFFLWPVLALLALIQVLASDSATSLGATGGIIALLVVFLGFRGRKTFYGATAVAMISVFSTLTILAATNLVVATGLLGKNSTFTGRLPLWQDSFSYGIAERPWFGHGWLAFWTQDRVSFEVLLRANWKVPHAHNAFIDTWLYLGLIGVVLLVAIYIRGLIWGARNIRAVPSAVGLVPIILISYSLIFSLTEAGVVRRDISFIFFVVACVTAAKNKGERRPFSPAKDDGSDRATRTNLSV
jgi:exopolysaccharide production protein ExoQ